MLRWCNGFMYKLNLQQQKSSGFTLIELLAVIIILGVLLLIAVPMVSKYIENSRKATYIINASRYIEGAKNMVNAMEFKMYDKDTTYYLPIECIELEKGEGSPFGKIEEGYVVITYDGAKYNYYFTVRDSAGYGILLASEKKLSKSDIISLNDPLNLSIGVGDRKTISIVSQCKNTFDKHDVNQVIPENGSVRVDGLASPIVSGTKKTTPYFNEEYNCLSNHNGVSNNASILFFDDGAIAAIIDGEDKLNYLGDKLRYENNIIISATNDEAGTVSSDGKEVYMNLFGNGELTTCTLTEKFNIKFENVYVYSRLNISAVFYQNKTATLTDGSEEIKLDMIYGKKYIYYISEGEILLFGIVKDDGNKIEVLDIGEFTLN